MKGYSRHELRRWGSDNIRTPATAMSAGSSPGSDVTTSGYSTPPSTAEEFVEVTLDIEDDETIILRSVEPATTTPSHATLNVEPSHLAGNTTTTFEIPPSSSSGAPPIRRTTSSNSRIRQFSQELKAEISRAKQSFSAQLTKRFSGKFLGSSPSMKGADSGGVDPAIAARNRRRQLAQLNRTRSGAQRALKGLRFISSKGNANWSEVESNFEKLAKDGFLYRTDFAKCIGMENSKEFALEMFDALSRRRRLKVEKISKDELYEYWSQITDQSFDSRLQIFFDIIIITVIDTSNRC